MNVKFHYCFGYPSFRIGGPPFICTHLVGGAAVKSPIHFHCVLHGKKKEGGGVQIA